MASWKDRKVCLKDRKGCKGLKRLKYFNLFLMKFFSLSLLNQNIHDIL